jgi:two-component system chemotaxis response regulator CheB
MGDDGVAGCQKIKECGGTVLVQNEASALMYGMPGAVVEAGWADAMVSDVQLAECLRHAVEEFWEERASAIPLGHRPSINRNGLG